MRALVARRSFLALIGLAAAPQEAVAAVRPPARVHLLHCPVAGLPYYDHATVTEFPVGLPLVLRRQPDNPHDRRAIEVLAGDGTKLGYVPRIDNPALASLMDAGYALHAETVRPRSTRRGPVCMAIAMVERA